MSAPTLSVPFAFQFGSCAGRIVRASLEETQKANIGRKYARKDKRPLDPPPVIRLRCYQTVQVGMGQEVEQEFQDFDEQFVFGFICHADLIQVTPEGQIVLDRHSVASSTCRSAMRPVSFDHDVPMSMPTHCPAPSTCPPLMLAGFDGGLVSAVPGAGVPFGMRGSSSEEYDSGPVPFDAGHLPEPWAMRSKVGSAPQYQLPDIPGTGNQTPEEGTTCTNLLAGETFVPCSLVEYEGQRAAMFVFSDLAVRQEGHFILRYRVFNICGAHVGIPSVPVLAECYGGPFEIFSTKLFPGLPPSTDLTKRLSLSGFRVNSRHRERRSWKKAAAARSHSSDSPIEFARGSFSSVGVLGSSPSRTVCRAPNRNAYYQPSAVAPYAPSFSGELSSCTPPQYSGMFGSEADSARNVLAEWQGRALRDFAAYSRDGSSPGSGTDESVTSAQSLW